SPLVGVFVRSRAHVDRVQRVAACGPAVDYSPRAAADAGGPCAQWGPGAGADGDYTGTPAAWSAVCIRCGLVSDDAAWAGTGVLGDRHRHSCLAIAGAGIAGPEAAL